MSHTCIPKNLQELINKRQKNEQNEDYVYKLFQMYSAVDVPYYNMGKY